MMAQTVVTAALLPYRWTMDRIYGFFSATEKDEKYCQTSEEIISGQQQTINELTTNQERQINKCKKFSDQVIYLSEELYKKEKEKQLLLRLVDRHRQMAGEQNHVRNQLETQLEEMQRQMDYQKMESQNELENLTLAYNELHQTYTHFYNNYETDLNAQKDIAFILSRQIQIRIKSHAEKESVYKEQIENMTSQIKSHADTVAEYKELIHKMTYKQNVIRQRAEHEVKRLQQEASEREMSLSKQLEDLKIQLHEQTTKNLELHREEDERQRLTHLLHREKYLADEQYSLRIQLEKQLEEMQSQMDHQKMESQNELENLTFSYNELHQAYSIIYHNYETDLSAEKQISVTLSQQLETQIKSHSDTVSEYKEQIENMTSQIKSHSDTVSEYKELIHNMTFEQNAIRQKAEQETKLLQQEASEREKSLSKQLEDLKIQLHEQTTKNLELVAQFKAEEEVSQVVCTEAVQIVDELKDQLTGEIPHCSHDQEPVVEDEASEEKAAENMAGSWNITRHFLRFWKKKKTRREEVSK